VSRQKTIPIRKEEEHQVRTYIRASDHKRVDLFARRNDMRIIDVYRLLIRFFLDHDGKTKPETDKTGVHLSLKTFRLLDEQMEKYGVDSDVLIYNLLTATKDLFRARVSRVK